MLNAFSTGFKHAVHMLGLRFGTILSRHSKTTVAKVRERHRQSFAPHAFTGLPCPLCIPYRCCDVFQNRFSDPLGRSGSFHALQPADS